MNFNPLICFDWEYVIARFRNRALLNSVVVRLFKFDYFAGVHEYNFTVNRQYSP